MEQACIAVYAIDMLEILLYSYDCAGGALSSFFFLDIYKQLVIFLGHPRVVSYCVGLVIPIATKVNNPRTRLKTELGFFFEK